MWPMKERTSKASASVSQRMSPLRIRSQASGRSAKAGASSTTETASSASVATSRSALRAETPPSESVSSAGASTAVEMATAMGRILAATSSTAQAGSPPCAPCG